MTVETEVANLTTAVDNLTASVNVAKGTLDAKVSDAQTAEANAASHEVTILGYKNAAETAAASAVSVVQQDLSALGFDVPHGAVAICPIDPYEHGFVTWPVHGKQSWRSEARATGKYLGVHGTTASAWAVTDAAAGDYYWDSTNGRIYELTGTSGASQVFRAGSANFAARWAVGFGSLWVLLQEDGSPWMSAEKALGDALDFNQTASGGGSSLTSIAFVGSTLITGQGSSGNSQGIRLFDFASDQIDRISDVPRGGHMRYNGGIGARNDGLGGFTVDASLGLVNLTVNAVAATVLPDAPIKSGVPVPTIAVATDGGVSVIRDDGSVVNPFTSYAMKRVYFTADNALRYTYTGDHNIRETRFPFEAAGSGVLAAYGSFGVPTIAPRGDWAGVSSFGAYGPVGRSYHKAQPAGSPLATAFENPSDVSAGMVAYQAEDYTTPPLFGDVRGAFLNEQGQAGTLVGANLRTDPFDVVTDWVKIGANADTLASVGGEAHLTKDATASADAQFEVTMAVTAGDHVSAYCDGWRVSGVGAARLGLYNQDGTIIARHPSYATTATHERLHAEGVATGSLVRVRIICGGGASAGAAGFDNLTVDIAHPDRSVNGKGVIVNGSLTQDADGWVSGFGADKYLEQPYNADLDLNVLSIHGEFNTTATWEEFLRKRDPSDTGNYIRVFLDGSGVLKAAVASGATAVTATGNAVNDGLPHAVDVLVDADTLRLYCDAQLVDTQSLSAIAGDLFGSADTLRLGCEQDGGNPVNGKMRRWIVSGGLPSHAQIKVMSDWVGDNLSGTFKDMHFVAETGVLHVLTDAYHYEVDADGAVLKSTPNTSTWLKVTASRDGVVRTS